MCIVFLSDLQTTFDSYSKPKRAPTPSTLSRSALVEERPQAQQVEPVVRVPMQSCVSKPVVAERVKWKLAPTFDPLPYLSDPVVREAYKNPDVLRKPENQWPRLPKAIVHARRGEVLALATKWDEVNACRVVACSEVRDEETVGMFCVPKDAEWGRLILNPTVVNRIILDLFPIPCLPRRWPLTTS